MAIFSVIAATVLASAPALATYGYGYTNVHVVQPVIPALYKSPLIGWQYSHLSPPVSHYPFVSQPIYGGLLNTPCITSPFTSTHFNWPKTYVAPKVDIKAKNGTKHIFKEVYPPGFLTPIFSYQGSIQNIPPGGKGAKGAEGGDAPAPKDAGEGAAEGDGKAERDTEKEGKAEEKGKGGDEAEKKEEKAKAAKMLGKKKGKRSGMGKKLQNLSRMPKPSV